MTDTEQGGEPDGGGEDGQKRRSGTQKRQRVFQIKTPLLKAEFNAVATKAADAGMSRAAWSRAVMLGDAGERAQRRPHPDKAILIQILGQVGKIGGNINQIAKHLNTGGQPEIPEIREALQAYADIRTAIYDALNVATPPPTPDKPYPDQRGNKPRKP